MPFYLPSDSLPNIDMDHETSPSSTEPSLSVTKPSVAVNGHVDAEKTQDLIDGETNPAKKHTDEANVGDQGGASTTPSFTINGSVEAEKIQESIDKETQAAEEHIDGASVAGQGSVFRKTRLQRAISKVGIVCVRPAAWTYPN